MEKLVVAVGETLWDLLPAGPVLGGALCNFTYRMNSLGARALLATRLGEDDRGRQAAEIMLQLGMDPRLVQWDSQHPTGTVNVFLDESGNPDFHIVPEVAYDYLELTPDLEQCGKQADCICFGTLIQRAPKSRATLQHLLKNTSATVKFLDINLRKNCFTLDTIVESLEQATLLKLNLDEAHYLAELLEMTGPTLPDFCLEMVERWSLTHCVVTLGDKGAFALAKSGEKTYVPGFRVNVLDTCGSGDAFAAAFTHSLLHEKSLKEACLLGCALGALAAGRQGATAPIAAEEIESFLANPPGRITEPDLMQFAGRS